MEPPTQAELQIPSKLENRQVLDIAVVDGIAGAATSTSTSGGKHFAAVLLSENMLVIFDLASRTVVFRAKYNDATDNISHLYFVADRYLETPVSHQSGAPIAATTPANQSPTSNNETTLMGFLLLVETKLVQKGDTSKTTSASSKSISRAKHLRKLHLVQILQTQVTSRSKIEKRDKIEQLDALTFGEEQPKLVEFIRCKNVHGIPNYFTFLLTRERVKATGTLKLITVKIRWAPSHELKNEEHSFDHDIDGSREESKNPAKARGEPTDRAQSGSGASKWSLKFDCVTSLAPKIDNFKGEKNKPAYLNVIEAVDPALISAD